MKAIITLLVVYLTGCTTLQTGVDRAASANDTAITTAEWTICRGASVGSVRRAYGDVERAEIWRKLCASSDDFSPEQ